MDRILCAAFFLLIAAIALTFIPHKISLSRQDLATLDGRPIERTTLLTDLAHAPATGQPAVHRLIYVGDRFVFGGYSPETIPSRSMSVAADTTVGELLKWISGASGWPARVGTQMPRRFFAMPAPTARDPWPQIQFGSPTLFNLELIHRWDVRPVWLATAVAFLAAAVAWGIDRRRAAHHG